MSALRRIAGSGAIATRYRRPCRCRSRRTASSGCVSRDRIACILRRRPGDELQDFAAPLLGMSQGYRCGLRPEEPPGDPPSTSAERRVHRIPIERSSRCVSNRREPWHRRGGRGCARTASVYQRRIAGRQTHSYEEPSGTNWLRQCCDSSTRWSPCRRRRRVAGGRTIDLRRLLYNRLNVALDTSDLPSGATVRERRRHRAR